MSPEVRAASEPRASTWSVGSALLVVSYAVLGAILAFTRLFGLGESLWLDEAHFVQNFVRTGPHDIFNGGLSHELYALLDWMTASAIGESVIAFRLWSAVPFIVGVALVTVWLHRRVSPLAGLLYLFLATVSPLLLDLSRQARGYGLAFFAMSVLVLAALEAERTGRVSAVLAMCAAGVVGTWTLPQFGFAFIATAVVVVANRRVRLPVAIGVVVSIAAIMLWYAPHTESVQGASQDTAGTVQTSTVWLLTAPIDQIVLPALIWIEAPTLTPGLGWLPFVLLAALVMGSSPLLRRRGPALILCSGPIATVAALWAVDAYTAPRFLSFLLVQAFILLASGGAAVLAQIPARRAVLRTVACLLGIGALAYNFASYAPDVVRLPREANQDAARWIESHSTPLNPVYAQLKDPIALQFYLDRPITVLQPGEVASRVCNSWVSVIYVVQPWAITLVDVPCLQTRPVQHARFDMYARGGKIDVWFVPPQA